MDFGTSDARDLLPAVFSGIDESPPWESLLRRLMARTRATQAWLFVRPADVAGSPPLRTGVADRHAPAPASAFDLTAFDAADLLPYASLRPFRTYGFEEMLVAVGSAIGRRQREVLADASVAFGRFIRIGAKGGHDAWLILLHHREDFGAGDSALLTAIAPHLATALTLMATMHDLRRRAAIAEEALGLAGVGQAVLDHDGRIVFADAVAAAELGGRPGLRPDPGGAQPREVTEACRALRQASDDARRVVRVDRAAGRDVLLRRSPVAAGWGGADHVVGLVRRAPRLPSPPAAAAIQAAFGLSAREAALALALADGRSIVAAGTKLGLTAETARNYSKRIYAKTHARGQADLVRMLLSGLLPFA